jgi:glycosyltransferase involved in cell wall biosynthesis
MNPHKGDDLSDLALILVSPNVSESMGGEAIKALQIYLELSRRGAKVHQITHERVKTELGEKFPEMSVSYIKDSLLEKLLFRWGSLNPVMNMVTGWVIAMIFQYRGARLVRKILRDKPGYLVHFTTPVSPVLPYFRVPGAGVVIGPLNGNIHYPKSFRHREAITYRVQRTLHPSLQFVIGRLFTGKRKADRLLAAGGLRTRRSLLSAGCRKEQIVNSIDSGVLDRLVEAPRISHRGENHRFVHNGRLVAHKGTDLAIRSLKRTKLPVELDVIGRGPELEHLRALTCELGLERRVRFIEWIADHRRLAEALSDYRGFVFPSLAEANGIVVQEAMVMGLPVIALNWGGPELLITPETGVLIDPTGEEQVIDELAAAMDRLAADGDLAERLSVAGRQRAVEEGYLWSSLIRKWATMYRDLGRQTGILVACV